jgi:UDP-N-acetylmuramoyl-tripeptide--D-alanyl-D-alanine ligase
MEISSFYSKFFKPGNTCTDSRKIKPGDIFIALKGDNYNGSDFADSALINGACIAVVENDFTSAQNKNILRVDNTLQFLQNLATYHRRYNNLKIIGLTGSNGKTTTKELIRSVLGQKFTVQSTPGNLNNHIGVPLTLLSIEKETQVTIIEMGANHPGEIRDLCHIALPQSGLITNIGKAHLDGFNGYEGVKKAKAELFEYIKSQDGKIYLNGSDPILTELVKSYPNTIRYNIDSGICNTKILSSLPTLTIQVFTSKNGSVVINTSLYGNYNLSNIAAAIAIGMDHGLKMQEIKEGIENYLPDAYRSQVLKIGDLQVIADCYNANPTSMELALRNFASGNSKRKMIVLGGMKELGMYEREEHFRIGNLIEELNFDLILLFGEEFESIKVKNSSYFNTFPELENYVLKLNLENVDILIKGSRSNKLERLIEVIKKNQSS